MNIFKDKTKLWNVHTEGDIEGKSIRDLGIFFGSIEDIAFRLRGTATFTLSFSELKIDYPKLTEAQSNNNSVIINVEGLTKNNLKRQAEECGINIKDCNYYNSIKLFLNDAELKELKIKEVLLKLTEDEKEILGLNEEVKYKFVKKK